MTATNHALTGAIVAISFQRPEVAIPMAFLTHFFLDSLPHFGIEDEDIVGRNKNPAFMAVVITDIMLLAVVTIWLALSKHHIANWILLASAAAAYSPDVIWIPRFISEVRTHAFKPGGWFVRLHRKIQREHMWGIWVEAAWLVAAVTVIVVVR